MAEDDGSDFQQSGLQGAFMPQGNVGGFAFPGGQTNISSPAFPTTVNNLNPGSTPAPGAIAAAPPIATPSSDFGPQQANQPAAGMPIQQPTNTTGPNLLSGSGPGGIAFGANGQKLFWG
jgi:hypothetical protein